MILHAADIASSWYSVRDFYSWAPFLIVPATGKYFDSILLKVNITHFPFLHNTGSRLVNA